MDPSALFDSDVIDLDSEATTQEEMYSPNMAYLGSLVLSGKCVGVVVNTGHRTLLATLMRRNKVNEFIQEQYDKEDDNKSTYRLK